MFYDKAKLYVKSGNGGDGMISFRREKFVPLGGPDGGDGGKGGDVIFVATHAHTTLIRYHRNNHYRATNGIDGHRKKQTGARGEDVRLEVPVGTVIRHAESGDLLADLTEPGQEVIILAGGRGGKGNIHYSTGADRAPRIAERGEPGEEAWVELELKLIADVGIVGVPNAGKSTLLSVVSGAKPKIADYPFTTLQPNLGVVSLDNYDTMIWADIPGLIEGASQGQGLGHDFLRHIERTRVLIHLLDGASENPLEDWAMINQELALYDVALEKKPQIVVLNKMDLPQAAEWEPKIKERVTAVGFPFLSISAVAQQGLRELLNRVKKMLVEAPPPPRQDELIVIRPEVNERDFWIEREAEGWRVHGRQIERIATMTYFEFDATAMRFQRILEGMGISEALRNAGIQEGDIVYIAKEELEWSE